MYSFCGARETEIMSGNSESTRGRNWRKQKDIPPRFQKKHSNTRYLNILFTMFSLFTCYCCVYVFIDSFIFWWHNRMTQPQGLNSNQNVTTDLDVISFQPTQRQPVFPNSRIRAMVQQTLPQGSNTFKSVTKDIDVISFQVSSIVYGDEVMLNLFQHLLWYLLLIVMIYFAQQIGEKDIEGGHEDFLLLEGLSFVRDLPAVRSRLE